MRLLVTVGLLLAWAMPALTAIVIWSWMFDSQYGVVNWVLTQLGMDYGGHSWLLNPLSFFAVATLVITWQSVPFVAFTLYAGLTQVPGDVLEAAQIDGANARQRFRLIIVPFIKPILLIVTVLQVIWDLRVFTQIFALQDSGGITEKTSTIGVYIYQVGVAQGRFDIGSTIAVIMVRDDAGRRRSSTCARSCARRTCEHLHRLAPPGRRRARGGHRSGAPWCRCPERESSSSYGVHGAGARAPGEPRRGRGLPVLGLPGLLDGHHVVPAQQPDPPPRPDVRARRIRRPATTGRCCSRRASSRSSTRCATA